MNLLAQCLSHYADHYDQSRGAAHMARLAASANTVPPSLLRDLAHHMHRLGADVVAMALAIRLHGMLFLAVDYNGVQDFALSLLRELRSYRDRTEGLATTTAEIARRGGRNT